MIGQKNIRQIMNLVLKMSKAEETEVLVVANKSGLTRFANNEIHQNMISEDVSVSIRAIFGKRVGVASGNIQCKVQSFDFAQDKRAKCKTRAKSSKLEEFLEQQLKEIAKRAEIIARAGSEDPEFAGLPKPVQSAKLPEEHLPPRKGYVLASEGRVYGAGKAQSQVKNPKTVYEQTLNFTPEDRARAVGLIIKKAEEVGLTAFGSLTNGVTEYAVANSKGIWGYHPVSTASLNIRVMTPQNMPSRHPGLSRIKSVLDSGVVSRFNRETPQNDEGNIQRSGYAGFISTNISDIDFEKLAYEAIKKATIGGREVEIIPGEYEVILEEPAVSEMMQFLSYLGFGAKQFHEGSSFLTGRLGERVLGENVTIHDDPFHPLTIPMPFDFEGVPKEKLVLVNNGVAKNIVYDWQYAKKYGKKPTGHGLPWPNTEGPIAFHLSMASGSTPRSELIKKVKKGILVTRFWYVNPIHPKLLNITGMTRDGTFLIENGKITGAVRNLRFTQSIPEALLNVLDISSEVKAEEGWAGANVVPAIRIGKWNFTGESRL